MAVPAGGRLPVGRAFGIPVYLHLSWVIVFGLIAWTLATGYFPALDPDRPVLSYWLEGLLASALLFGSIFLHEMAHALTARAAALEIRSVTLFMFGGVAEMPRDPEDGRTELRIAAAGPVASLAVAGMFGLAAAAGPPAPLGSVCRYLAWINAAVAVFNLVPAFPLDGGRILRAVLWKPMGKARATRAAAGAGTGFAFFLMISGVVALFHGVTLAGAWYVALGLFLQQAASSAYDQARLDEVLGGLRVRDVMLTRVDTLPGDISLGEAARYYFLQSGYASYPVERAGAVVGLLCLRDLRRVPSAQRDRTSVQAAMRPLSPEIVIGPDEPLLAVLPRMARSEVGRLLVLEDGRLVGLMTLSVILRQVAVRESLAA
jgi:Zn-dependent protease/CBS domain-containing protein